MRSYMLLTLFLLSALITFSQDSLFSANKYDKAAEVWYKQAVSFGDTPGNSFNIAIAEWKAGHMPEAMMAMEKARRMAPLSSKIEQKYKELRRDMENPVPVMPDFFLWKWSKGTILFLRPGMWMVTACGLLLGGVWIFITRMEKAKRFTPVFYVCIALAMLSIIFSLTSYRILFSEDEAIVWSQAELRIAASPQSPSKKSVSAGEKVKIMDKIGTWYRISLLNHDEGWVEENDIRKIKIIPRP